MKKTLLALSVLFATNAMAYQVATGKVQAVNVNPNSAVIEWSTTITNNDNCTHADSTHVLVLPLTDETKAQFSALLSANVSGKNARVLYDGCLAGLPNIIRVDLIK
jgi:hypothetical protein